ncbi:MAG: hypothetical protein ACRDKX_10030, partial [Solirubrobacterales bacterium]
LIAAHGSSKSQRLAGWQKRWTVVGGVPPLTARVRKTQFFLVGWAAPGVGDRLLGDRLAGDFQPLFPFVGASRLIVGVEQESSADHAPALLRLQQTQVGPADRRFGCLALPPFGPVLGKGRVVRGR